jgi:hypothetical protein
MKKTFSVKKKTNGSLTTYKSYNFVDKDPAIDVVRTMVQASNKTYTEIHDSGGPTKSCLHSWFDGKVKRPHFCTLAAATRAVGGDIVFVNPQGTQIKLLKGTGLLKERR